MGHKPRQQGQRAVVVCTDKRGVFFGYTTESDVELMAPGKRVHLKRARMCVYWSQAERGVLGLAARGPGPQCRIGPAVDITVRDVHAVLSVADQAAIDRWEAAPWG